MKSFIIIKNRCFQWNKR